MTDPAGRGDPSVRPPSASTRQHELRLASARSGRDVASAAVDVAAIAEALAVERFALMGQSGGASHALARAIPGATLWLQPDDGHISSLSAAELALDWLLQRGV